MDCSLPGSSIHGILQARILEWVAMPSSNGSSRPRVWTHVSRLLHLAGRFFTTSATWKALSHPYTHSTQRTGALREPAPILREVRKVTYTMAYLEQLQICPAKAKLASVGPLPTGPEKSACVRVEEKGSNAKTAWKRRLYPCWQKRKWARGLGWVLSLAYLWGRKGLLCWDMACTGQGERGARSQIKQGLILSAGGLGGLFWADSNFTKMSLALVWRTDWGVKNRGRAPGKRWASATLADSNVDGYDLEVTPTRLLGTKIWNVPHIPKNTGQPLKVTLPKNT